MAVYKHIYITDDQDDWLTKEAHRRRMRVSHLVRILIEQERSKNLSIDLKQLPIRGGWSSKI